MLHSEKTAEDITFEILGRIPKSEFEVRYEWVATLIRCQQWAAALDARDIKRFERTNKFFKIITLGMHIPRVKGPRYESTMLESMRLMSNQTISNSGWTVDSYAETCSHYPNIIKTLGKKRLYNFLFHSSCVIAVSVACAIIPWIMPMAIPVKAVTQAAITFIFNYLILTRMHAKYKKYAKELLPEHLYLE